MVIDNKINKDLYRVSNFSANSFFSQSAREELEAKFFGKLEILKDVNRQSVSFQLSKNEVLHSWLKYKEGFSASLVEALINEMNLKENDIILDPFFGSGTTGLVSQMNGYSSMGFDILPTSQIAIKAKEDIYKYDINEIEQLIEDLKGMSLPERYNEELNAFNITQGAYKKDNELFLSYLLTWQAKNKHSDEINNLLLLCTLNCLEDLSYTRKDGQYLRWDFRSDKVNATNEKRRAQGKPELKNVLDKGKIPDVIPTVVCELEKVMKDIEIIQHNYSKNNKDIIFYQESVLERLPLIEDDFFSGVITSPPYCNRYDYTRTYALELAYLGLDDRKLKELRQTLLSCTVENKTKRDTLKNYYTSIGKEERYSVIDKIVTSNKCFIEIVGALKARGDNGDLNNKGIIRMVEGYFYELAFVFAEIQRTSKKGSKVFFVNDNVRYGGEVIPVDFLSCSLAEAFGFDVDRIYSIRQMKGNSSQQMKKYGKVALRKSITEWTVR